MSEQPKQHEEKEELVESLQGEADKLQDLDPKEEAEKVKGGANLFLADPRR